MFGTQDKRFDRFMDAILASKFIYEHDVYVQLGYTSGNYPQVHAKQYYSQEELDKQIKQADLIITHAGVGSIVSALKEHKTTIVVARLGKYKEQNNDHQVQIMERFSNMGYIIPLTDFSKLDEAIEQSKNFKPKEYHPDKQGILDEIETFIKNRT